MPMKSLQISAIMGVASAVILLLANFIPIAIFLVPLPLFVAAFTAGVRGALIAMVSGGATVAIGFGLQYALGFLIIVALPSVLLAHTLERPMFVSGATLWGVVYVVLAGFSMAIIISTLPFYTPELIEGLQIDLARMYNVTFQWLRPEEANTLSTYVIQYLRASVAIFWVIQGLVNVALTKQILRRFKADIKESSIFRHISLPKYWDILVASLALATYLPGAIGDTALQLLLIGTLGFFLLGLKTIHSWIGKHVERALVALIPFYIMVVVMFTIIAPMLICLGLVNHVQGLRHRKAVSNL